MTALGFVILAAIVQQAIEEVFGSWLSGRRIKVVVFVVGVGFAVWARLDITALVGLDRLLTGLPANVLTGLVLGSGASLANAILNRVAPSAKDAPLVQFGPPAPPDIPDHPPIPTPPYDK